MWPVLPAVIGAGVDLAGMLFSKHEADTAHQREVADLTKAGINPLMTAQTRGSPMPDIPSFGADIQSGLQVGLAAKRTAAEVPNIEARTSQIQLQTDVLQQLAVWQVAKGRSDAEAAALAARALEIKLPMVLQMAQQELLAQTASARNAAALADINEAMRTGQLNIQHLQENLGVVSPMIDLLLRMFSSGALGRLYEEA